MEAPQNFAAWANNMSRYVFLSTLPVGLLSYNKRQHTTTMHTTRENMTWVHFSVTALLNQTRSFVLQFAHTHAHTNVD